MESPDAAAPVTTQDAKVAKNVTVEAVIIRADGTREPLGVISAGYKSRWKRAWWKIYGSPKAARRTRVANRNAERKAA